jgi:dTDP-4-amino-4,6-dideoxygalactose transaminase
VATVAAIELAGGRPVLADLTPGFYTLDPQRVLAALTPRTRFLLPVHLYGCPADLPALLDIARSRGLTLVEDCAQAHGARSQGRRVGSVGELGAFSFYPTKNLGAYGDGGAVVTHDAGLAGELRALRQYGWDEQRISRQKGFNSRLDELQAAILRVKLADLERSNARRRELAGLYVSLLSGSEVSLPAVPDGAEPVYHLFVIRHPRREALRQFLGQRGIGTAVHYPLPVHRMPAYRDLGYAEDDLPETGRACREVLSLPLYPEMSAEMVEFVCRAVREFLAGQPA